MEQLGDDSWKVVCAACCYMALVGDELMLNVLRCHLTY